MRLVGGGGGGVIEERYYYYYYYYYYCIVVATEHLDYVRHLKRAFYTKHMASSEDEARPKKETGVMNVIFSSRFMGWVDRSHIDPTTHIHPNKTKSIKSAIVA
jgi:hypothetical protein